MFDTKSYDRDTFERCRCVFSMGCAAPSLIGARLDKSKTKTKPVLPCQKRRGRAAARPLCDDPCILGMVRSVKIRPAPWKNTQTGRVPDNRTKHRALKSQGCISSVPLAKATTHGTPVVCAFGAVLGSHGFLTLGHPPDNVA